MTAAIARANLICPMRLGLESMSVCVSIMTMGDNSKRLCKDRMWNCFERSVERKVISTASRGDFMDSWNF